MCKGVIFIITIISLWASCSGDFTCKEIESVSPALKLKRHLFCDYDKDIIPTKNKDQQVFIEVSLLPVSVEMNEYTGTLDFHTWMIMNWQDIHLTWTPSDFNGVNSTYVKSNDIWVPDFTVFNSGDFSKDQTGLPSTDCYLQSDGKIQCAGARVFTTHCPTDFTNWPYDKHNCTLHFGSWIHYDSNVNLTFGDIYMHELRENRVWDVEMSNLTSFSERYERSWDNMFFLHVGLTRNPMRGGMSFVAPAVVILMITLTILWLDSRSMERIAISGVTFIAHILLVLDLHWSLPSSTSLNIPKILIFYEVSLILSSCILVLTSFLRKIYSLSTPAPSAVIILTSTVLNSPIGRLVNSEGSLKSEVTLEDGETEVSPSKPNKTWQECAIVFEWLALVIFTITYFILIAVLLPMAPKNPVKHYEY
uniref:Chrna6_0 protein n=2 Tax=Fopius arisanus TaxID=64838 RepID=A0A0C9QNY3_9HYME